MAKTYKTETLLKRLNRYDEKYRQEVENHNGVGFGYSMRAYHRIKVWNPPYEKTKEKAEKIKLELDNRGVKYKTYYV